MWTGPSTQTIFAPCAFDIGRSTVLTFQRARLSFASDPGIAGVTDASDAVCSLLAVPMVPALSSVSAERQLAIVAGPAVFAHALSVDARTLEAFPGVAVEGSCA
jgi:hypothetical protein